eukprot:6272954-Alexandrium_andersonii.AAC.1
MVVQRRPDSPFDRSGPAPPEDGGRSRSWGRGRSVGRSGRPSCWPRLPRQRWPATAQSCSARPVRWPPT